MSAPPSIVDPMRAYRAKRDNERGSVRSKYAILGFISSGTYGRVYKAQSLGPGGALYAIKKFKPDKEGEVITYTGISQSACREIALNREIDNLNVVKLREVILEEKSIYMVFEYAEHDFLQIIHHQASVIRYPMPAAICKSLVFQLLNGVLYLHNQHILHRDLKPANILVTSKGVVKIGDLGLARLIQNPLQPLYMGDKVVVTIWYRAPELLFGSKHYTKAVDCWAIGCILAELLALKPMFKGEEAKLDSKKNVPFQIDQVMRVVDVLGTPTLEQWPGLVHMPEYHNLHRLGQQTSTLEKWASTRTTLLGYDLISNFFVFDPTARFTCEKAMEHPWFSEEPLPTANAFACLKQLNQAPFPLRRISNDDGTGTALNPTTVAANAVLPVQQPSSISRPGSGIPPGGPYVFHRVQQGPVPTAIQQQQQMVMPRKRPRFQ